MNELDNKIMFCVVKYSRRFNRLTIGQIKSLLKQDREMTLDDKIEIDKLTEKYLFDIISIDYQTQHCQRNKGQVYIKFR